MKQILFFQKCEKCTETCISLNTLLRFPNSYPILFLSLNLKFPEFPFLFSRSGRDYTTKRVELSRQRPRNKRPSEYANKNPRRRKIHRLLVKKGLQGLGKVCVRSKARAGSSIAEVAGQSSLNGSPRIGWMPPPPSSFVSPLPRSFALSPLLLIHTSSFVGFVSRDNAAPGFSPISLFFSRLENTNGPSNTPSRDDKRRHAVPPSALI